MAVKPYIEKERYADAYADKIIAAVKKAGIPFPFPRKVDNIEKDGLRRQDFFPPDNNNEDEKGSGQ